MKKYEYKYVHTSVPFYEWDEAMEIGVIYAPDKATAHTLAWDSIPHDYTIIGITEVFE